MYFKERQRSTLYKREQQLQQVRLSHKLQEIKNRKLKINHSQIFLPQITHRISQIKPCQKIVFEMQTERLNKRILQLKSNRSQYFTKVIGINLPTQRLKMKKSDTSNTSECLNKSQFKQNMSQLNTKRLDL